MKIRSLQFCRGPNLWAKVSGLRIACAQVPLRDETQAEPVAIRAFLDLLAQALPVAAESEFLASPDFLRDSIAPEAGLVLALCEVVSRDFCVRPQIGEILDADAGGVTCFIPCDDAPIAAASLELALEIANAAPGFRVAEPARFREHFAERYRSFRQRAIPHKLDQSTLGMVRKAAERGIPFSRLGGAGRFVQLGQGVHGRRVIETVTDGLGVVAAKLSADKLATGTLLHRFGIPTPRTHPADTAEQALKVAEKLGYPLVVKPRAGGKGVGVAVNIRSREELLKAFESARRYRGGAVIERHVEGEDHRLLVVGGRFVAAARRMPGGVVGDGRSTVRQLVEQANRDPRRGLLPFERLLERIELDAEALQCLRQAGMVPDSVPGEGVAVALRATANISRGGSAVDVTGIIHPDNREIAERAARIIGADVLGIDFVTPDIARSWRELPAAILEVNTSPGLRPHLVANPEQDVFSPIVGLLFPEGADGRVPTVGVTGSLGKTSATAMIAAILGHAGLVVARATTQGTWIGSEAIGTGDLSYGGLAQSLLQDPSVEAGAFELARGALLKTGLALDALDVGVELGVLDNHIGIDGIESREDLARIKRLVVENARKLAVLNADDPLTLAMRDHCAAERIALVSARPGNPEVLAHRDAGGLAAYLDEGDELVLFERGEAIGRIGMGDLPACRNGAFRPAAVNALFAACACRGLGIGFSTIAGALKAFEPDLETSPGRNNLFENLPYRLLLSSASSPQAARALAELARRIPAGGRRRLLFTSAGNRPDAFIRAIAREMAGAFDEYYCTDWSDLRGRAAGEVAAMLAGALREEGVDPAAIHEIAAPQEAVRAAYAGLGPEDLMVDALLGAPIDGEWLAARALRRAGKVLVPLSPPPGADQSAPATS